MRTLYAVFRRVLSLPVASRCMSVHADDLWQLDLKRKALAQSGPSQAGPAPRIPQSFQIRMADESDHSALADYYGSEQTIRGRLERGDLCFMTLCQNRIGAAVWMALGPGEYRDDWDELQTLFQFPANVAWSYDGKGTRWGAWGALMMRLPNMLEERGIHKVATLIDCNNWQSHDAHRSLGYQQVGLLGSLDLCGLRVGACRHANRRWQFLPARIGAVEVLGR